MIQVSITNISAGQVQWNAQFATQDLATTWIAACESNYAWGKPSRTLTANEQGSVMDVDGSVPDLTKATSTGTTVDSNGVTVNTYTFAADYSVAQTDITAQVTAQAAISKGLQAQQIGATCVAQVYALNEAKFTAGTLTSADFQAILADTTLQMIERLLWNGSLATALSMIQSYTSPYFTSSDIASVAAIITNSGLV